MNMKDEIFYKKNGYLIKKNLISKNDVSKINKKIKYLIKKDNSLSNKHKKFEYKKINGISHIVRLKNPVAQDKIFSNSLTLGLIIDAPYLMNPHFNTVQIKAKPY